MNPFKDNGNILPIASLNRVFVDDKKSSKLFSKSLLIEAILSNEYLNSQTATKTSKDIIKEFNYLLNHELKTVRVSAKIIAKDFGKRLAQIISTLLLPSELSKKNKKDWSQKHWDYWKEIKKIYFVGGITSPILIKIFKKEIDHLFLEKGISDCETLFKEGSSHMGTIGLSTTVSSGEYLFFDFGQTLVKTHHMVKNDGVVEMDSILSSIESENQVYKNLSDTELFKEAKKQHNFILRTLLKSCKEVDFKGNTILMAIANYVNEGNIYPFRGGYGKLSVLSDNYEQFLKKDLSKKLDKEIDIKLYHDTSAMALNFNGEKQTAIISLGTKFGIAFP
ncbi:MAG: hypothetical protein K9L74_07140 [Candidatus Izimaplasma sp.]|nr:hypothetical protein [Candidatus Izimaplasma bacterium]